MKQTENTHPAHNESPEMRPDGWERFEKAVEAALAPARRRAKDAQKSRPLKS